MGGEGGRGRDGHGRPGRSKREIKEIKIQTVASGQIHLEGQGNGFWVWVLGAIGKTNAGMAAANGEKGMERRSDEVGDAIAETAAAERAKRERAEWYGIMKKQNLWGDRVQCDWKGREKAECGSCGVALASGEPRYVVFPRAREAVPIYLCAHRGGACVVKLIPNASGVAGNVTQIVCSMLAEWWRLWGKHGSERYYELCLAEAKEAAELTWPFLYRARVLDDLERVILKLGEREDVESKWELAARASRFWKAFEAEVRALRAAAIERGGKEAGEWRWE